MKKLTKTIIEKLVLEVLDEATTSSHTTGMPPGWHQAKAARDQAKQKHTDHMATKPDAYHQMDQEYYAQRSGDTDFHAGGVTVEPGDPAATPRLQHGFRNVVTTAQQHQDAQVRAHATKTLDKLDTDWGTKHTDTPDTTKWTHPYSSKTTVLGKGETQPKGGWEYKQHKSDPSTWINPWNPTDKGTKLAKGEKQPEFGWARTQTAGKNQWIHPGSAQKWRVGKIASPVKRVTTKIPERTWTTVYKGKTDYGYGSAQDAEQSATKMKALGGQFTPSMPVTAQSKNPTLRTYGAGSEMDYRKAQRTAAEEPNSGFEEFGQEGKEWSGTKRTTNPWDMLGPGVTSYGQGTKAQYQTASAGATGAGQSGYKVIKPTTNPTIKTTTFTRATPWGFKTSTGVGGKYNPQTRTVDVDNPAYATWSDQEQDFRQDYEAKRDAFAALTPDQGSKSGKAPPPPTAGGTSRGRGGKSKAGRKGKSVSRGRGRARSRGGKRGFSYKASKASKSGWGRGKPSKSKVGKVGKRGKKSGKKGREDESFRSSILKDIILELNDLKKYNK